MTCNLHALGGKIFYKAENEAWRLSRILTVFIRDLDRFDFIGCAKI